MSAVFAPTIQLDKPFISSNNGQCVYTPRARCNGCDRKSSWSQADISPPDLNPLEEVFSQVKSILKENDPLFQACSALRVLLASAFGMVTENNE